MDRRRIVKTIKDIKSDDYDPEDKLTAIQDMLEGSHNIVTKQDLLNCLEWLIEDYI